MYIDKFSNGNLNGCDELSGWSSFFNKSKPVVKSKKIKSGARKVASFLHSAGVTMTRTGRNLIPNLDGNGFLLNNQQVYLQGENMNGWLTDMTKPVTRTVRAASSAALGVVRTGVKSAAPAFVSALTGRPVQVSDAAGYGTTTDSSGNVISVMPPKDNTLLYAGLGAAGLLAVVVLTRSRK